MVRIIPLKRGDWLCVDFWVLRALILITLLSSYLISKCISYAGWFDKRISY